MTTSEETIVTELIEERITKPNVTVREERITVPSVEVKTERVVVPSVEIREERRNVTIGVT